MIKLNMYYINKVKRYWPYMFLIILLTTLIHCIYIFYSQSLIAQMYCSHGLAIAIILFLLFKHFIASMIIDLLRLLIGIITYNIVPKVCKELKQHEFKKVFSYDVSYFFKNQEEYSIENIRSFSNNFGDFVTIFVRQLLNPLLDILMGAIFILITNINSGIFVFCWLIVVAIVSYLFIMPQLNFIKKNSKIQSSQAKIISESHRNILVSKIYNYEDLEYLKYDKFLEIEADLKKRFLKLNWIQFFTLSTCTVGLLSAMVLSTPYIDKLSGVKILSLTYCILSGFFRLFANIIPIIQKYGSLLSAEEIYGKTEYIIKRKHKEIPNDPVIKFNNVSKSVGKDTFIKSINAEITTNENILIEGKSGSGKTTLFLLMLGIVNNSSGTITVNNIDLMDLDNKKWLDKFSYVPQNPILYDDTIRNNIIKGLEAYDEKDFKKVCKICLLDDFVDNLENGYDTNVGISGNNLSGGQRQRVAIARALMRDYNILNGVKSTKKKTLCLDEAWSALSKNEAINIANEIAKDISKRGFIVIDHTDVWKTVSKNTIDKLYFIENGILSNKI